MSNAQLHEGLSYEEYSALGGVSSGQLQDLKVSPAYCKWRRENPQKHTPALSLGSAVHTACLEPEKFLEEYAIWDGERQTKAGKEKWAAFQLVNEGKTILTPEQYDHAKAVGRAVRNHKHAKKLIAGGIAEAVITWTDEETRLRARIKMDYFKQRPRQPVLNDLKSTRQLSSRLFFSDAARLGYDIKMAFYSEGVRQLTGKVPATSITAMAVLPAPAPSLDPFTDIAVYDLPPEYLAAGHEKMRALMRVYAECEASGKWPGIDGGEVLTMQLPAWAMPEDDDEIDLTFGGERMAV